MGSLLYRLPVRLSHCSILACLCGQHTLCGARMLIVVCSLFMLTMFQIFNGLQWYKCIITKVGFSYIFMHQDQMIAGHCFLSVNLSASWPFANDF